MKVHMRDPTHSLRVGGTFPEDSTQPPLGMTFKELLPGSLPALCVSHSCLRAFPVPPLIPAMWLPGSPDSSSMFHARSSLHNGAPRTNTGSQVSGGSITHEQQLRSWRGPALVRGPLV